MKISIITAVLNREDTIGGALDSLQEQTHGDFEHLIQDGGSTDGTLDEVRRCADERSSIVSEPDSGIYDAINKGIARATGDVIGLLHSDDVFGSNEVLAKVCQALSDSTVQGVYGDLEYVSTSDLSRVIRHWRSKAYDRRKLSKGWMPPHPTLFLRREVFDRWGAYDTNYEIAADYDAILRWLGRGGVSLAYIPEVLVKMRVGGESNRSLSRILRKSREDYRALRSNNVGGLGTLALKNLSKIGQFFFHP
jgi:glycosyltransferase